MMRQKELFLFLLFIFAFICIVFANDCNINCEPDNKKICGTSEKPKKFDTIKTFSNECSLKKYNCENPKDSKENRMFSFQCTNLLRRSNFRVPSFVEICMQSRRKKSLNVEFMMLINWRIVNKLKIKNILNMK